MRVLAQVAMVMNLDKCIGCHTCSVTCKQTWTNRDGVEYVWFNNVETKPGIGYPVSWENNAKKWKGGWELDKKGNLRIKQGGRLTRLALLFSNPYLPQLDDYYEPATYDYDMLLNAPAGTDMPTARPKSAITGKNMDIKWGPNWDDDLSGSQEIATQDPNFDNLRTKVADTFEQTFMFHLPRICEHCLNPACVSACPSGAMYKREKDGIVLVDQDKCRGWRMCVSACPYKKVYMNHVTGKAEKCTFCFPRIEEGLPTVCSETCVGRIRYIGVVLYDPDKVLEAASTADPKDLAEAQRACFLDPFDPAVLAAAREQGLAEDWIDGAQKSPIWKLAVKHKLALPLHPEYRTMPMVWYIPPLSPVLDATRDMGGDNTDADDVFHAITQLRIPLDYLAEIFTGGNVDEVAGVLMKLAAIRTHMRRVTLGEGPDEELLHRVGASAEDLEELYRLLSIAPADERTVVPMAHREQAVELASWASGCSLDAAGGPGMDGNDEHGKMRQGGLVSLALGKRRS